MLVTTRSNQKLFSLKTIYIFLSFYQPRILKIAILCVLGWTPVHWSNASVTPIRTLDQSLVIAGPNRPELQKFLDVHKEPEAEFLIRMASPSDLVNLTSGLLSDNLEVTDKAKSSVPWASRIPDEIWQEFVLPYRVADEPLDDFKPELYGKVYPNITTAQESGEAALLVHKWYWTANNGAPWVTFQVTESRDQSPRMLLDQTKAGRCFEMNLLCVALLRSVGIPARIAGVPYWMNSSFYHYWVEYYDTQTSSWLYFEGSSADTDQMLPVTKLRKSLANLVFPEVYALPGFCSVRDPVGKERWDALINTTSLYLPTGTIHFVTSTDPRGRPPVFTIYTWNLSAWRSVARATGDNQGQAEITVAANDDNYPYLVSMATGTHLYWQTVTVAPNASVNISDATITQDASDQVISLIRPSTPVQQKATKEE